MHRIQTTQDPGQRHREQGSHRKKDEGHSEIDQEKPKQKHQQMNKKLETM